VAGKERTGEKGMRRKEEGDMREDMDGKVQGLGGLHTLFLSILDPSLKVLYGLMRVIIIIIIRHAPSVRSSACCQ